MASEFKKNRKTHLIKGIKEGLVKKAFKYNAKEWTPIHWGDRPVSDP